jgi:hypothetical protein
MRRALSENFPAIVDGFIKQARKGSCPHVKLATELLHSKRRSAPRKKGSLEKLMQKLDWEQLEREQAERERKFGVQRTVAGTLGFDAAAVGRSDRV